MAYETGNIASSAAAASVIKAFAQANGWTLTGNVLSKGGAYIEITAPSVTEVWIRAAKNNNFAGADLSRTNRICLTSWPASATYHLAAFSSLGGDTIWFTMNFDNITHAHLGFGNLVKYGTWNGGQWFHAQHTSSSADSAVFSVIDGEERSIWGNHYECSLFWNQSDNRDWDSNIYHGKASFLHCELRGFIWECSNATKLESDMIHCPRMLKPINKSSPNVFNGQTILVPFQLYLLNTDGHYMSIGHVEHVRWVKMTNYNPGDVIQIGSDRWKLFPWHQKDVLKPNGKAPTYSDGSYSTGVLGVAVRYDGP